MPWVSVASSTSCRVVLAYDVKERGVMLSTGQRQLIAFVRAYAQQPGILILDEATSSIDPESEQLIQGATERLTKGRTSVSWHTDCPRSAMRTASSASMPEKSSSREPTKSYSRRAPIDAPYHRLFELQFDGG